MHEKTVLTCTLCGETAVEFTVVDNTVHVSSKMRSYESEYLRPTDIKRIQREDLKRLNLLLSNGDGLDYYCPECDEVYCADHWKTTILFEDTEHGAWFDCIEGTCPKGHNRILKD